MEEIRLKEKKSRAEKILQKNYFKLRCILVKESCPDIFKNSVYTDEFGEE